MYELTGLNEALDTFYNCHKYIRMLKKVSAWQFVQPRYSLTEILHYKGQDQ